MKGQGPMTVCSRPSSNRASGFPAHGFPSAVRRWACAARQELELKFQEILGAGSREARPSPLRHFASWHRHKCPPLAPRGLCSPTDQRYYGGLRLLPPPDRPRGTGPLVPVVEIRLIANSWREISQFNLTSLPDMPPTLTPPQRSREDDGWCPCAPRTDPALLPSAFAGVVAARHLRL